ncbi:MAG: peptide chain release factor N(5)-glutamine methyltransferase [Halofilum sp. (in: g-proteobacteria)]
MNAAGQTIAAALAAARARLSASPTAALDAELLLAHALGRGRSHLHAWPEAALPPATQAQFEALVRRRAGSEPIAYLLGQREFWSLDLRITPDVLIPRPETEGLVEIALAQLSASETIAPSILDAGTGSGCIALALAHERPDAQVVAVEHSTAALALARQNAERLGVSVEFLQGEWLEPVAGRRFHVIVSNPPYVRSDDPHLEQGDARFEPRAALDGGPDGLDAIRVLATQAGAHLSPGGLLALEHGADEANAVARILTDSGWSAIELHDDLASLPRFVTARQ